MLHRQQCRVRRAATLTSLLIIIWIRTVVARTEEDEKQSFNPEQRQGEPQRRRKLNLDVAPEQVNQAPGDFGQEQTSQQKSVEAEPEQVKQPPGDFGQEQISQQKSVDVEHEQVKQPPGDFGHEQINQQKNQDNSNLSAVTGSGNGETKHLPPEFLGWLKSDSDPFPDFHPLVPKPATPVTARHDIPLTAHSGTHHVQLFVGVDGTNLQTLIVDTGSKWTAWNCQPCPSCGWHQASHYYDPAESSTIQLGQCRNCKWAASHCGKTEGHDKVCVVQQRYFEGSSWTAYEVDDLVTISTGTSFLDSLQDNLFFAFTFGCQTRVSGLFAQQYADGILGLEVSEHSIVAAMYRDGLIDQPSFSLCLGHDRGRFGLGGALTDRHYEGLMGWTPNVGQSTPSVGQYAVQVDEVLLDNVCVACKRHWRTAPVQAMILHAFRQGKGTILDSGTSDTYLPQAMAGRFAKVWTSLTADLDLEANRTVTVASYEAMNDMFPTLRFVLQGNVTLSVPPNKYMEGSSNWHDQSPRELTHRLYVEEKIGAVLGINAMLDYDIVFDKDWIGFVSADCEGDPKMRNRAAKTDA